MLLALSNLTLDEGTTEVRLSTRRWKTNVLLELSMLILDEGTTEVQSFAR